MDTFLTDGHSHFLARLNGLGIFTLRLRCTLLLHSFFHDKSPQEADQADCRWRSGETQTVMAYWEHEALCTHHQLQRVSRVPFHHNTSRLTYLQGFHQHRPPIQLRSMIMVSQNRPYA